ncbi:RdgB/HAM1 family non-canonical purine NTP pyrophosphatase [Ginsengibacter hankyongi]|uniref:dITP/XTP pyrophosphatase n=1 Tax=Ginsengibacter hankyongi TaxID=2607284 RepID=A0A5J5IP95_9BACT|nr:RdgB/HAM1 family non-canonical purine NTP pyrophosphatase [Ginsengibacter hankyongi]KAA9041332.1 RdgB/HAM1 family non-canonical purine NTP pyrophosphatase [Ginsengibacter hankyongi]
MNTLIFATNNLNKVIEVRSLLGDSFKILSLSEAGIDIDVPEPFDTLEENAIEKSEVIYKLKGLSCFAEDTGLEVEALNGEPGVKSARYAGDKRSFEDNINKLLDNLKEVTNRKARFRTVICLTVNGKHNIFEGECKGSIIAKTRGAGGFGYDPVFIPEGATKTFAEMSLQEKNIYSHRKKATEKLIAWLKEMAVV